MNDEYDPEMDTATANEREMINITARDALKWVATTVVSSSVGTTISLIIKQNAKPVKRRHVVSLYVGAWALGGLVGELTEPYVEGKVDDYIEMAQKARAFVDKLTK